VCHERKLGQRPQKVVKTESIGEEKVERTQEESANVENWEEQPIIRAWA
jgi:hypothetical protein